MISREEMTQSRRRAEEMNRRWGRGFPDPQETPRSIIVRPIKKKTYPTQAKRVYACKLIKVPSDTAEAEGVEPAFEVIDDTLGFVINVGRAVPPDGQADLIADPIDGFWVVAFYG